MKERKRGKGTREGFDEREDGEDSRFKTGWEKKKYYDDPSSDSFAFLTTLKNRWTLSLIYLVVIVNPHVPELPFIPCYFRSFLIRILSSRQWYAAPITEEKMSHHGQFSYYLYTYVYVYMSIHIGKRSRSKMLFVLFSFSLSVTSWYTGRAG